MSTYPISFVEKFKRGSLAHWGFLCVFLGGVPLNVMRLLGNDPTDAIWGRFAQIVVITGGALVVIHWLRRACNLGKQRHST